MGLNKRLIDQAGAAGFEPTDNFAPVLYTGNGSTQSITSLDFQPDLVWIKNRSAANGHLIYDSIRGAGFWIASQLTTAEDGASGDLLASFDSNGFTVNTDYLGGTNPSSNNNGDNFVAWCWKAGGAAASNTDGSITSQVSANPSAGFSIVKYTGTGSNTNFGHGLDSSPELTIIKNLDDGTRDWIVHPSSQGNDKYLILNGANAINTSSIRIQSVNSTVVNIGTNTEVNANGQDFICYNFHSVDGYQKIGSYEGGTLNTTITTGFQPRFVMLKNADDAYGWAMFDSVRGVDGSNDFYLAANDSAAEANVSGRIEFLSTGFQLTTTNINYNGSGDTYIYLAIA